MNAIERFTPLVPQERSEPRSTMDMIGEAAARGASIEVIEKLMGLHERFEAAQARRAFDAAMADAKKEMPIINKNKHVGFNSKDPAKGKTDYDHEDLAEIVRVVSPILGKYGLSHRFRVKQDPNITVTCIISHRDGHFEENELSAGADNSGNKNSIQAIGSTITYLQRYSLKSALGLAASKDDDAKTADVEPEKISEDQLQELLDLADEVELDKAKFCRWANIESFADITPRHFAKARQAIEAKRKAAANV